MTPPVTGVIWSALPVPALLIAPDPDSGQEIVLDTNPAAESFLMVSARALAGRPLFERLAIAAPMEDAFARTRRNRSALFVHDVDVGTGSRVPINCNLQLAPIPDQPDVVLMLISPREIAGRLNQAGAAKAAVKSASGMSAMLAHEIRNPLAGISGAAQLLSMNLRNGDLELTELIVEETRRIMALLQQFEEFGDQRPPKRAPLNIHDVLERARRSARLGFAAHMKLSESYDPSLPPVWGDADQLLQVFLNLLKNAAEAQPSGGSITVRTCFEQSLRVRDRDGADIALPLHVEIIDDGPGLPPDIAADVFDPFVSGRENGTGLGLALVSKIVAAHDGWIAVESAPGRTVFRVSLPLAGRHPGAAGAITRE